MTCKEKLAIEHPEKIKEDEYGGCIGCPHTHGYRDLREEKAVELVIASSECGDWEALYINGRLIDENHHLQATQVLSHLGQFLPITLVHMDVSDDTAEMGMPQNLSELTIASGRRGE